MQNANHWLMHFEAWYCFADRSGLPGESRMLNLMRQHITETGVPVMELAKLSDAELKERIPGFGKRSAMFFRVLVYQCDPAKITKVADR